MTEFCCKKFQKIVEEPESAYARETTFTIIEGKWWTDFSENEYGDIQLDFCPFCGSKLTVQTGDES